MDVFMNLMPVYFVNVKANCFKKLNRFYLTLNKVDNSKNLKLVSESSYGCLLLANKYNLQTKSLSPTKAITKNGKIYFEFNLLKELDGQGVKALLELIELDSSLQESTVYSLIHSLDLTSIEFNIGEQVGSQRMYQTFGFESVSI